MRIRSNRSHLSRRESACLISSLPQRISWLSTKNISNHKLKLLYKQLLVQKLKRTIQRSWLRLLQVHSRPGELKYSLRSWKYLCGSALCPVRCLECMRTQRDGQSCDASCRLPRYAELRKDRVTMCMLKLQTTDR